MHLDGWTLALQTVNFAVLVWLLHRFLYRPVLRMVDARKAAIQHDRDDVKALDDKAKAELAAIETARGGMAAEREAVLNAASAQALAAAQARHAQAEQEAQRVLDGARAALAAERERALVEAQRVALELGAQVALRLLDELPTPLRQQAWIERVARHLETLPTGQLDALKQQLAGGGVLQVLTAVALPAATAEQWRTRLREPLGSGASLAFAVDSRLVAGAELHFPQAILRFSWLSVLDTLQLDLSTHAHAH